MTSPSPPRSRKVLLHLTGFGQFAGVPDNPTTHLMRELPKHLSSLSTSDTSVTTHLEVLETSMEGVQAALERLFSTADEEVAATSEGTSVTVFHVHFGVHTGLDCFNLERQAFNEAHFRVPDERGAQPQHEPVLSAEHAHKLLTPLPIDKLTEQLVALEHKVEPSDDAGRFVCNYTYYLSLSKSAARNQAKTKDSTDDSLPQFVSLFVHVPSFKTLAPAKHLALAQALLEQLVALTPA